MKSVFTTFVVKDNKKKELDLYSVAYDTYANLGKTYSERVQAFINYFNNLTAVVKTEFSSGVRNVAEGIEGRKLSDNEILNEDDFDKAVEEIKNKIISTN